MTAHDCAFRQALVRSIRLAVEHADAPRLARLLDLLEQVADEDLLNWVEASLTQHASLPSQRRA